jgi:hypothetical protein
MKKLPRVETVVDRLTACTMAALAVSAALLLSHPASASVLTFEVFDPGLDFLPFNDPGVPPTLPGYGYPEGFRVPTDYGDNITATSVELFPGGPVYQYGGAEGFTPHVTASYGPFSIFTGGPELFRGGFGDLNGILYQGSRFPPPPAVPIGNDYNHLDIILAAEPGYDVLLYGFDLAGFLGDYTINAVTVFKGVPNALFTPTNQLFEEFNVLVEGAGAATHTTFDEARLGGPLQSHLIWIRIDSSNLGPIDSENIGIDNIRFGEVFTDNPDPPTDQGTIDAALQPGEVPEAASMLVWLVGGGAAALVAVRRRRPG